MDSRGSKNGARGDHTDWILEKGNNMENWGMASVAI